MASARTAIMAALMAATAASAWADEGEAMRSFGSDKAVERYLKRTERQRGPDVASVSQDTIQESASAVVALMGYELVEGRLDGGRIAEQRRLDFAPPPRTPAAR